MRCSLIVMAIVVVGLGFASADCGYADMLKCIQMMSEPCKMLNCYDDIGCYDVMPDDVKSLIKDASCDAGISRLSLGLVLLLAPIQLIMYYGKFP